MSNAFDLSSFLWSDAGRGLRPPRPNVLDKQNSLAQGLSICFPDLAGPDVAGTAVLTKNGSPTDHFAPQGVGKYFGNTANSYLLTGFPGLSDGVQYTIAVVGVNGSAGGIPWNADRSDGNSIRIFQFNCSPSGTSFIPFDNGATPYFAQSSTGPAAGAPYVLVGRAATKAEIWVNGVLGGTADTISGTIQGTPDYVTLEIGSRNVSGSTYDGTVVAIFRWNRALTNEEVIRFSFDPWGMFAPLESLPFPVITSGGVSHATSGTILGGGSSVAGTSVHVAKHATSGVLVGSGAAIAGTAARTHIHTTAGALTGAGSTVVGAAARTRLHATSGVLTGSGATVAGTAHRTRLHATSGALPGQTATINGTASRASAGVHPTTGALVGAGSAIAGTAAHKALHTTAGVLTGGGTSIVGAAQRAHLHTSVGVLAGAGTVLTGAAARTRMHATSGALPGGTATIVGAASRASASTHATTGTLVGAGTTVAGTAHHTAKHGTMGVLTGAGSTITGTAHHTAKHATSGVLLGPGAAIVGTAARSGIAVTHTTSGVLVGGSGHAVLTGNASVNATNRAFRLPPPPPTNDFKSPVWQDWFYKIMSATLNGKINLQIGIPLKEFANDGAAATGGIPIYGYYRTGNVVMQRIT